MQHDILTNIHYKIITMIKLINISITSFIYCVYKICSQSEFQVHTTLTLTNSPYYTHPNIISNPIFKVLF